MARIKVRIHCDSRVIETNMEEKDARNLDKILIPEYDPDFHPIVEGKRMKESNKKTKIYCCVKNREEKQEGNEIIIIYGYPC
jgi:Mn-dependent DtxR family transcriptional regulator